MLEIMLENPFNRALLDRLATLDIPEVTLTAGCLFQTVWNVQSGQRPEWGINDYDVFYYDPDTRWSAENRVIKQVEDATRHLGVNVEVRNQARVHLWFKQKFGVSCDPIYSVRQGIDQFLMPVCSVGIDAATRTLYSTHGLHDLEHGVLRMNPLIDTVDLFLAKAEHYQKRWPWLTIIPVEKGAAAH